MSFTKKRLYKQVFYPNRPACVGIPAIATVSVLWFYKGWDIYGHQITS